MTSPNFTQAYLQECLAEIARDLPLECASTVGARLRDVYQIPSVRAAYGKKLTVVLGVDQEAYELKMIKRRLDFLTDHCQRHHKDYPARRQIHALRAKAANLTRRIGKRISMKDTGKIVQRT